MYLILLNLQTEQRLLKIQIILVFLQIIFFILLLGSTSYSEELNKIGTFKDWDAIVVTNGDSKVCFAQSKPVVQSPKKK